MSRRDKKKHGKSSPKRRTRPSRVKKAAPAEAEGMRLNKYVAHSGVCSRRQAAEYVKNGLVTVNGKVEKNPAYQVQAGDQVRFRDRPIRPEERKVYLLLNKPKDVISTVSDDRGRRTVIDLLGGRIEERVFPVGRLDRNTTGLLLLTNDGDLAKKLTHPSHKVNKVYHVTLDKPLADADLQKIRNGVELEEGKAVVDGIDHVPGSGKKEVGMELHIGWNRIVRRLFEALGYEVQRLDRVYFAGLTKKDLPRGRWRKLTEQEVIMLKHFSSP
jgi:23S rRNA pseudouridine2605 synthase